MHAFQEDSSLNTENRKEALIGHQIFIKYAQMLISSTKICSFYAEYKIPSISCLSNIKLSHLILSLQWKDNYLLNTLKS